MNLRLDFTKNYVSAKRFAVAKSFVLLLAALSIVSCSNNDSNQSGAYEDPFADGGQLPVNDLNSLGLDNGGSGTGGSLTTQDTTALNNLFKDQQNSGISPQDQAAAAVSQAFQAQINALLEKQRKGQQIQVQMMALAGQMMQDCAQKVGILAPVPGQPLMGLWGSQNTNNNSNNNNNGNNNTGYTPPPPPSPGTSYGFRGASSSGASTGTKQSTACPIKFTIVGAPPLQQQTSNKYQVSGDITGTMVADANGIGVIQGGKGSGNVRDTPMAGNGTLRLQGFIPATGGKNPQPAKDCDSPVVLLTSANPIPANYTEAVARLGCCFKQSLMLMSPTMVELMGKVDPRLATLLIQRSGCGGGDENSQNQGQN